MYQYVETAETYGGGSTLAPQRVVRFGRVWLFPTVLPFSPRLAQFVRLVRRTSHLIIKAFKASNLFCLVLQPRLAPWFTRESRNFQGLKRMGLMSGAVTILNPSLPKVTQVPDTFKDGAIEPVLLSLSLIHNWSSWHGFAKQFLGESFRLFCSIPWL